MMVNVIKTAAVACLAMYAASSYSATQQLIGTNVTYEYDDTQAALALFGTPTIVGDTVSFLPPNFRAESANGAGVVTTAANFIFDRVYSTNNREVSSIFVSEFGDYNISGPAVDGLDNVSATLLLTAKSNTSSNPLFYTADLVTFGDDGAAGNVVDTWTLDALVDPAAVFFDPARDVAVSIQNTLTATTDGSGELAWIQKKLTFTTVAEGDVLPPIPIPAAAWLFGSALLGLVGVARKKRA